MSEEEVAAAAAVAHAHGKRLSAHARSAESVKRCIRNGINMIYHANYADEEALDMLEENRDWLFVSPNIGFTAIAAYEGSDWFTEEQVKKMGFREELQSAISGIRELMKRGVRILGGGDYGFMITPHGQNARDLDHFMQHGGMTPMEAMLTMTKNGGEAMGLTDSVGQVKEGFLADLLLVKGDPLANPKVLLDTDNLAVIMKDGQVHKRSI
jgi:imidazolonepropionase-like amidohydrolase